VHDPQRGRRKVPRAVREQQMLAVAGQVFAARGFHEASMDEIADGAGISKPMIYNYFGSKEGLYSAYVEDAGQRLLARMAEAAAGARPSEAIDPEATLRATSLAFFAHVDENRESWSVLFGGFTARGGPLVDEVASIRRTITDRTAALFDAVLLQAGTTPAAVGGTQPLAHAFVGAGESLANWWLAHPAVPEEEVVRLMLRFAEVALAGGAAARPAD
jgi:AcrR family transcriptional regulator